MQIITVKSTSFLNESIVVLVTHPNTAQSAPMTYIIYVEAHITRTVRDTGADEKKPGNDVHVGQNPRHVGRHVVEQAIS